VRSGCRAGPAAGTARAAAATGGARARLGSLAAAAAILIEACLAGCGSAPGPAQVPADVLPVRAVSGLPATTRPLSAADVQKDSSRPGLTARLHRWGYLGGWQRTFQGESRRLTLVVSRSLTFRSRTGAEAFVGYLDSHLNSFYPFASSRRLALGGQPGWLIKPPMCACHMAQPFYVGVTVAGPRVRWLEINGPRATGRMLAALLSDLGAAR
jgi:hypothetical protein